MNHKRVISIFIIEFILMGGTINILATVRAQDALGKLEPITASNAVRVAELMALEGHIGAVFSVVFSPNGYMLATTGADNAIRLWDVASGESHGVLEGNNIAVGPVAFSPDGKMLASAECAKLDSDNRCVQMKILLWNVTSGKNLLVLEAHTGWINALAFNWDGTHLASGSSDKTAKLWDVATGENQTFKYDDFVIDLAFSPDDKTFVTASGQEIWFEAEGSQLHYIAHPPTLVLDIAFNQDGSVLASALADGTVHLWNTVASPIGVLETNSNDVGLSRVEFSPNGALLAGFAFYCTTNTSECSAASSIALWDVKSPQNPALLEGHTKPVYWADFSPDSSVMATSSLDETVRLWDSTTSKEITVLTGQTGVAYGVAFNPNGTLLVTGGADGKVHFWGVRVES
jgi:WD40 repeat protein